jgi:DNA-binding CsgD family transcriptional regulator
MKDKLSLIDIEQDLIIFRTNQGIKLVKPGNVEQESRSSASFNTGHTIASLSTLPFNFYFLNLDGETLHMNQQCVEICGFQSINDSLGKSLFDVSSQASAAQLINNCNEVIRENKIKIFEEENVRKDGIALQFLSVKSPWYNNANEIKGIFGCSIVLGKQSLAESLLQIVQLGLLNPANYTVNSTIIPSISHESETLSERESLCVFHLCKGFTMKETAKIIGLSPKTVETYIERAKQKFHCKNKAELIAAFLKETKQVS